MPTSTVCLPLRAECLIPPQATEGPWCCQGEARCQCTGLRMVRWALYFVLESFLLWYAYTSVSVLVCADVCGGQRLASSSLPQLLTTHLLRRALSLNLSSLLRLDWLVSAPIPQDPAVLEFQAQVWGEVGHWDFELRFSYLSTYPLRHLPSSLFWNLSCVHLCFACMDVWVTASDLGVTVSCETLCRNQTRVL